MVFDTSLAFPSLLILEADVREELVILASNLQLHLILPLVNYTVDCGN